MSEPRLHPVEDIERLELRIETLEDSIARSRRLMLVGRVGVVVGPLLLVALTFGLIVFTPARVLLALALLIGGVVLTGSSKSSTDELEGSLASAQAQRNEAIDTLGLAPAAEERTAEVIRLPRR
jgi:hypothetical protein